MCISAKVIKRIVIFFIVLGFLGQACLLVLRINDKIYPQIEQMARVEAANAATQIIKRSVSTI